MPPDFQQQMRRLIPRMDEQGFAFIQAQEMRELLDEVGAIDDWKAFAASWDDLAVDTYMADQGRYRRRRYAVYRAGRQGPIGRCEHQPHFQTLTYNPLHGDIERWFEPITEAVGKADSLRTVIRFARRCFGQRAESAQAWHIEVHQFRIEAHPDRPGMPTPEGMHRDGVDFVLVLMINRCNIASGTTTIHGLEGAELGSFTLTDAFDAALVDDHRVYHGVTPVEPVDPAQPSYRDVLVVTFRAVDGP